jgi:hypothetical protein
MALLLAVTSALSVALALGAHGDEAAAVADAGKPVPPSAAVPLVREGAALALSRHEERLYVASEELSSIRVFAAPGEATPHTVHAVPMPGAPANLAVLADDRVLVTVRDPGLLLVLRPEGETGLVETARVAIAADAWGLAVSPDGSTAYVTSAWTHVVTAVDIAEAKVRWTLDVSREPRGVVAHPRGPIYVSHLVSGDLTRIDVTGGVPVVHVVHLPLAPLRAPRHGTVEGSLGYALVLAPDGQRLFALRHALGAIGDPAWFGAAAADVLLVPDDIPLAPPRAPSLVESHVADSDASVYPQDPAIDPATGPIPMTTPAPFSQPRAAVYRPSTRTLLVAGEADRHVTELDALAPDPTLAEVRAIGVGYSEPYGGCVAPSGIALSADDSKAYVYCRASFDVAVLSLGSDADERDMSIGSDPLDYTASAGRILFYTGRREGLAADMACSGCHPEGRDDGHVWHEVDTTGVKGAAKVAAPRIFVGGSGTLDVGGAPRQTPMLAGRLASPGPYGWLGADADLVARITHGADLHRWSPWGGRSYEVRDRKAAIERIAKFVRVGLVPPPGSGTPLTPVQLQGKALFERSDVGCASCHVADTSAPAIVTRLPPLLVRPGFDEEDVPLKVPSLRFVGGTPPYLHDGSATTLLEVVERNRDRMGHTGQLTPDERIVLAAYLETL